MKQLLLITILFFVPIASRAQYSYFDSLERHFSNDMSWQYDANGALTDSVVEGITYVCDYRKVPMGLYSSVREYDGTLAVCRVYYDRKQICVFNLSGKDLNCYSRWLDSSFLKKEDK